MSPRLRLLFLGNGGSVHTQRWLSFFTQRHDVALLSIPPLRPEVVLPPGITLLPGSRQSPIPVIGLLRFFWDLKRALRSFRPDIVHAHLLVPNAWLAAASGFRPFVLTAWGSDLLLSRGVFRQLNTWAIRRAALCTGDSQELLNKFIEAGAEQTRVSMIQWGVDIDRFSPNTDSGKFLQELSIPPDAQVLVSPRILQPLYNTTTIAEAFIGLAKKFPKLYLLISRYNASPDYETRVRSILGDTETRDRVRFLDAIKHDDMPKLYRAATIILSVPSSDSTAVTLLEAMASGVSVVASDLPSVREWITDGKNGSLVKPADADALRKAIQTTLELPPTILQTRTLQNRALVAERASHEVFMRKMEQHYLQLARPKLNEEHHAS